MGLFNKMFGQDKTGQPNETQQNLKPCKTEKELLERFGANALDKQLDLNEIIGSNNWNVDMAKGEISFGSGLVFPIQVLGTFSHAAQTWLWAWANTKSGLSDGITQQAQKLKTYGEENEIDLLRNSEFDATKDDLHLIGLTASGMFDSSGYYLADYGQGTMVVTIKSEQVDKIQKDDHLRILTVFSQFLSQFEVNHHLALKNYLSKKGYGIVENESQLTATKNGNTITAAFDASSRLIRLNG